MNNAIFHSVEIDQCVDCQGLWLDHQEIDELFVVDQLPQKLMADSSSRVSVVAIPEGSRTCPRCNEFLTLVEVDAIRIDVCSHCKGFFLDPGEFKQLALASEERFRGEHDEPI